MAAPVRLLVSGATGRMGRAVARLLRDDPTMELVGGLDREGIPAPGYPRVAPLAQAEPLLRSADAVLDFSAPAFVHRLLEQHGAVLRGRALVVGTTGLDATTLRLLDELAAEVPVLQAANFSVGVNLLLALAEQAAQALGPDEYDVEIVEAHHRRKEDAPSGTALALGEAVARGREAELDVVRRDGRSGRPGARPQGEVGFHAVRGGDVAGEHQVLFLGGLERVELTHRASDRSLFAAGALHAVRWLAGRPAGRYAMHDVLGIG